VATDDAAAQASLADALHLRVPRRHRREDGPALAGLERVDGHPGRLVDGDPARTAREHREGCVGLGLDEARVRRREGGDPHLLTSHEGEPFRAAPRRPPTELDAARMEHAPGLRARDPEPRRQEDVEPGPGLGGVDAEDAIHPFHARHGIPGAA
jgi:hypothetical protein